MLILTPGPTTVHAEILKRLGKQVISHRSEKFRMIFKDVLEMLKEAFFTEQYVAVLTGSGTLAVDAMLTNLVHPKDKVLLLEFGEFGSRMYRTLRAIGAEVTRLTKPLGEAFRPSDLEDKIDGYDVVCSVYTETSTGAKLIKLKKIAEIVKENGALFCLDAVSAMFGEELKFDEWGIDAVATCSHKNLGAPPGLSFVALSKEALKKAKDAKVPLYLNLQRYIEFHEKRNETPYTPALNLIFAIREALSFLHDEGISNRIRRFSELRDYLYKETIKMSLDPFPEKTFWSNNVAVIKVNNAEIVRKELEKKGIVVAGGMGELKDKVIRVGIMGFVIKRDLDKLLKSLREILIEKI